MNMYSCLMFHTTAFRIFFFNDTATTEIYTLSLHDALPIYCGFRARQRGDNPSKRRMKERKLTPARYALLDGERHLDRKSTRLNSSHANISYAVFCLKKKIKHSTSSSTCHPYC